MEITGTDKKLITVSELAEHIGISTRTVWRLVSTGDLLPPIRIGGNARWQLNKVNQWIDAGCPKIKKKAK